MKYFYIRTNDGPALQKSNPRVQLQVQPRKWSTRDLLVSYLTYMAHVNELFSNWNIEICSTNAPNKTTAHIDLLTTTTTITKYVNVCLDTMSRKNIHKTF